MRTIFILVISLLAGQLCAADTNDLDPRNVLKANGVLTITDGSSYYTFSTNGTFSSSPTSSHYDSTYGLFGRYLDGTWTLDSNPDMARFYVIAKMRWMNGLSNGDEYRKIVFLIYTGHEKPDGTDFRSSPTKTIFDCYFIIDELVKIPKPDKSP